MVDILATAVESLNYDIESELTCEQCDSRFRKVTSLKKHIDHEHSGDVVKKIEETSKDKFNCKLCASTFLRERNLNLHMRIDHNGTEFNSENLNPSQSTGTKLMEVADEFMPPESSEHSDGRSISEEDLMVNGKVITMDDIFFTTEEENKDNDKKNIFNNEEQEEEGKKDGQYLEAGDGKLEDRNSTKSVGKTEHLVENMEDHVENTEILVENTEDLVEYAICPDTGDMIPVEKGDEAEDEVAVEEGKDEKDHSDGNVVENTENLVENTEDIVEYTICPDTGDMIPVEKGDEAEDELAAEEGKDEKDHSDDNVEEKNNSERKTKEDVNIVEEMIKQPSESTVTGSQDEELLPENFFQVEDISEQTKESTVESQKEEFLPDEVTLEKGEHSGAESELVLNGEAIVMDDIAYDILASTLDQNEGRNDEINEDKLRKRQRRARNIPVDKDDTMIKSEINVREMYPTVTEKQTEYLARGEKRKNPENVDSSEFESKGKKVRKYTSETKTNLPAHAVQLIKSIPKSTRIVFSPSPGASPKVIAPGSSYNLPSLSKSVKITAVPDDNSLKRGGTPFKAMENIKRLVGVKPSPEKISIFCEQCPGLQFQWKKQLREHMIAEHSYKCEMCKKKFEVLSIFTAHIETHKVRCDKCPEVFTSKNDLIGHKREKHTVKCTKCKHTFDSDDKCKQHMKKEHEFQCSHCRVVFDYQVRLEQHTRKEHTFPCSSCGVVTSSQAHLDLHEKEKHSSCEVCEDEFSWAEPGHSCFYTKNNVRPLRM